jgi:acyl-CoA hydrolase
MHLSFSPFVTTPRPLNESSGRPTYLSSRHQEWVAGAEWVEEAPSVTFSGRIKKTADQSREIIKVPAYPEYINELGHVKAGHVLKLIDIAGSIPPKKHLGKENVVVTASLDRTNFINPIRRWEMITLESRLTQAWNSSMETQVVVSAWNFQTGETRPIATAYLVFVALDKHHKKIQAPELVPTSLEDYRLAQAAELRKLNRKKEGKVTPELPIDSATDNPIVMEWQMTPNQSNALNNVFGGVILDCMDEVATQAARRQALDGTVVGVRIDRMSFLEPCFIGETLRAKAIVTKTWNTSMEVKVEVEAINPTSGQVREVARSYLVYVGLGPDGKPVMVPPWVPETDAQKQRAIDADLRRQIREKEEAETTNPKFTSYTLLDEIRWWWNRKRYH